jgi:hypothetical protein
MGNKQIARGEAREGNFFDEPWPALLEEADKLELIAGAA